MKTLKERKKMLKDLHNCLKCLTDKKEIQETKAMIFIISGYQRVEDMAGKCPKPRYIRRAELWLTGNYHDFILFENAAPSKYKIK